MPELEIPREHIPGIKLLVEVEDEVFRALLTAADKVSPALSAEKVAIALSPEVEGIDLKGLEEITAVIVSLQMYLRENEDLLIEDVVTRLTSNLLEREEFSDFVPQIDRFKQRFHDLLTSEGIFRTIAKTFELRIENERILAGARVVTDVRPIFKDDVAKGMAAAMVAHTLRITYRDATGQKEFYTALDELGLNILLEQILRAQEKAEAIRSMLEKASIPQIEPYTD